MTDDKKQEITRLSEDLHEKRLRYQRLGMQNIAGLSAEERKKSAVAHALAGAEYYEALAVLEMAVNPVQIH